MSVCPRDPIAASSDATLDPVKARLEIAERFANMAQSVGDGRCLRRTSVEMGAEEREKVSRWESPLVDVILWAFALVATGVTCGIRWDLGLLATVPTRTFTRLPTS